jgi:hypothetical protein
MYVYKLLFSAVNALLDCFGDQSLDERILRQQCVKSFDVFIWLRIGANVGLL